MKLLNNQFRICGVNTLVAGFEPWGTHRRNLSGELAREACGIVLPVDWNRADRLLKRALRERRPGVLILLGLAESRKRISLEKLALNLDFHESAPWRRQRPIERGGPWIREGRLPWTRILKRWSRGGLPAALSHHAGTFLCNHIYYRALQIFDGPCGFVHLPPLKVLGPARQREALQQLLAVVNGRAATPSAPRRASSRPGS